MKEEPEEVKYRPQYTLKEWLIKKLGGYTKFEVQEIRNYLDYFKTQCQLKSGVIKNMREDLITNHKETL